MPIADNFPRNSFACGNLNLLAPCFLLFECCLSSALGRFQAGLCLGLDMNIIVEELM